MLLISDECHVETMKNIGRAIGTFDRLKGVIIQFWALTGECSSGFLFSTSNQPFAPRNPEPVLSKYRLRCRKYAYCSSSSSSSPSNSHRYIISNGLVGDTFQEDSQNVVKDLNVHKGPLVDCALKCGLTSSVLFPCYSDDACVGVVECCLVNSAYLSGIISLLNLAFMNVRLKWPTLQSISDLKHDHGQLEIEIDDALKTVCEIHNLALGQVWMFSKLPTTWDCDRSFLVRLSGYHNDDSDDDAIKAYYDISSLPFQMKQTLPGMAFHTRQPFFLPSMPFGSTSCSCFVIRLKNCNHPRRSYAFEFIWPQCKNYLKLLESVLLTLKRSLPSFRPPPGLVTLGGELSVLNADDFRGHVCGCFNVVLKDNRFSGIPIKPSYEESTISNLEVNQHDQSTVGDADTNTNGNCFIL